MDPLQELSQIILGFYTLSKIEKTFAIVSEIISGKYLPASNKRRFLIKNFKLLVQSMNDDDYGIFKSKFIEIIPKIIIARGKREVAYSVISELICHGCRNNDGQIYYEYEKEVLKLVNRDKEKYFFHFITVAQTKKKILGDISNIELFFMNNYLKLSKTKTINNKYLNDFVGNVYGVNKKAILHHLMKLKPFRNDYIVNMFITSYPDLEKYAILI